MSHVYHEPLPSSPQEHEEGELLPEGFHDVIIDGHEIKAGDPESEMSWDVMNIKVRVLNGPAKGQAHTERIGLPHEGEKTGWQRNRTLFLRRLGFIKDADYAAGRISVDYEALPLKGKTCTIEIVHREGKKGDRKFANVKFGGWYPLGYRGASNNPPAVPSTGGVTPPAAPAAGKEVQRDFSMI